MNKEEQQITFDNLPEGEMHVQRIIRQVHGDIVTDEKFIREGNEIIAQLTFDGNQLKFQTIKINLTNLARKQKEDGLTDAVLRYTLQIRP